jgi:hypothetical protein
LAKADSAVQPARSITGTGALVGGGDLSANRTIDVSAATKASLVKADGSLQGSDVAPAQPAPGGHYPGKLVTADSAWAGGEAIEGGHFDGNQRPSGPYSNSGATGTLPWDGFVGVVFHQLRGERPVQLAIDYSSGRSATRGFYGRWGVWREDAKRDDSVVYASDEYVLSGMTATGAWRLPKDYVVTGQEKTGNWFDTTAFYARKLKIS